MPGLRRGRKARAGHGRRTLARDVIGIAWGTATDRGTVRAVNEDALLAEPPLFVVADGMGGHAAGDVASQLAIEGLSELIGDGPIGVQDVIDALTAANAAIVAHASQYTDQAGMGTTVTGLALVIAGGSEHWMVFNVGDSRVYRLADDEFLQLTVDHSEAEELVTAGRLTREQVYTYRRRNVVTRSLGIEPPEVVDSWIFPPVTGERFLVCSDGLTGEVRQEDIRACLESVPDPQAAADALVRAAIDAGGTDNVTVLVVDGLNDDSGEVNLDTAPRRFDAS